MVSCDLGDNEGVCAFFYRAFKKVKIHWSADGIDRLDGADAFDEINGTRRMYYYNILTDWNNGTDEIDLMKNFHNDFC